MSEHKLRPTTISATIKAKWEDQKAVGTHHRYIWRSSEQGNFKYPKELYGALKNRRTFKQMRFWVKRQGLRGQDRAILMANISGIDE